MGLFDNIGGFFSGSTAKDAADQQIAGLTKGYGDASDLLSQGRGALTTNFTAGLQPFLGNYSTATAGTKALTDALGITGDPTQVQAKLQQTPGYQFNLNQGTENVLRNASRTGSLASGNTNTDLTKFASGLADNTYNNYVQSLQPFLGAAGSAASGIGGIYTGLGTGLNQSFGTQANAAYGTDVGIGNANANATLAQNSGVANLLGLGTSLLGLGSNTVGGKAISSLIPSDVRLKENVEDVGELYDGQRVYRYNYRGDDVPHIGLMAQEVAERHPEAVGDIGGGFLGVDYGKATQFASRLAEFL